MSKMDNLRAMREARYARATAKPATARPKPLVAPRDEAPVVAPAADAGDAGDADGLCGHRSMNGRTCTREAGHAAKSHRYS
ncbi:hypothetical protein [Nocardioides aquiterrae]|uniref:Uncharacterized protein n=1 Tax=Nocardioides aquiterrae TaxID=203799 RepID=A0ABN1UEU7_9ACTN